MTENKRYVVIAGTRGHKLRTAISGSGSEAIKMAIYKTLAMTGTCACTIFPLEFFSPDPIKKDEHAAFRAVSVR